MQKTKVSVSGGSESAGKPVQTPNAGGPGVDPGNVSESTDNFLPGVNDPSAVEEQVEVADGEPADGEEGADVPGGDDTPKDPPLTQESIRAIIREEMSQKGGMNPQQGQARKAFFSEDEYREISEKHSLERGQVDFIQESVMRALEYMDKKIGGRLFGITLGSRLDEIASDPKFADARGMKGDVEKFLNTMVAPEKRESKEALIAAIQFVRGGRSKGEVKRVMETKDRNRIVAGKARPAAPTGRPNITPGLSGYEKTIAKKFGMSESQYAGLKGRKKQ